MSYSFGDVVYVKLPEPPGSPEQKSREQMGSRPAVIIQNECAFPDLPTLLIVPFTKNLSSLRYSTTFQVDPNSNGLEQASAILPFQLQTIDKKKILCKIGEIEEPYKKALKEKLESLIPLK